MNENEYKYMPDLYLEHDHFIERQNIYTLRTMQLRSCILLMFQNPLPELITKWSPLTAMAEESQATNAAEAA